MFMGFTRRHMLKIDTKVLKGKTGEVIFTSILPKLNSSHSILIEEVSTFNVELEESKRFHSPTFNGLLTVGNILKTTEFNNAYPVIFQDFLVIQFEGLSSTFSHKAKYKELDQTGGFDISLKVLSGPLAPELTLLDTEGPTGHEIAQVFLYVTYTDIDIFKGKGDFAQNIEVFKVYT